MATGISGIVIDIRTNAPVDGADVKLSGPKAETKKTDNGYEFLFDDLSPANNYSLTVSAPNYQTENYTDIVVIEDVVTNLGALALFPTE